MYDERCLICLSYCKTKFNDILNHDQKKNYIKKCECDFFIHRDCFNSWNSYHTKCIICHKKFNCAKTKQNICIVKGIFRLFTFCLQLVVVFFFTLVSLIIMIICLRHRQ